MFAYQKEPKLQLALLEKIFEAYFEQEKDIGSHEMLAGLAEDAGVASKDEVRLTNLFYHNSCTHGYRSCLRCVLQALEFLASDKLYTEVQAQIMEAQGKGITGVPCTVINQKYAISGGQKSDVYIDVRAPLRSLPPLSALTVLLTLSLPPFPPAIATQIFEKLAAREIPVS